MKMTDAEAANILLGLPRREQMEAELERIKQTILAGYDRGCDVYFYHSNDDPGFPTMRSDTRARYNTFTVSVREPFDAT